MILTSLRTRWAAVGAAIAVTLGAAGIGSYNLVNADVSSGDRPVFVPLNPCRLTDTRAGATVGPKSSPLGPNETITITAHGSNGRCTGASAIPTDAVALSLNVTAVGQTQRTFLTIWGEGADPGTSNLNPEPGQPPTPNAVNTPLSAAGTFNVRNNAGSVNALIDVVGYYADHNHDDRYPTLSGLDSTIVVRAFLRSDGILTSSGELPPGVTLTASRTGTGRFSIELEGVGALNIESSRNMAVHVAPQSALPITCTSGSGSSASSNGVYLDVSRTLQCVDSTGTATNSSMQVVILL